MGPLNPILRLGIFLILMLCSFIASPAFAETLHYTFVIQEAPYTRLCSTKNILTVNGSYPGPTISARNNDTVFVNVINNGIRNITLHWHGIVQPQDPWSDGPEYITQCPIQPGGNFTQRVRITEEEGTLWWHAHSDFDRATVHGAIVIRPKVNTTYPFKDPDGEFVLILGEWWKEDVAAVYEDAVVRGNEVKVSDANTINGQPGDFASCSQNDTLKIEVEQGKIYLLRVINSALSNEYFFGVARHNLTVVGADASYTKPYVNYEYIMITPGQTFDLLLEANQLLNSSSTYRYYIVTSPFFDGLPFNHSSNVASAILEYKINNSTVAPPTVVSTTTQPKINDTNFAAAFTNGLRSLASSEHPVNVPQTVDERILITIAVNKVACTPGENCTFLDNSRIGASLNNASFQSPIGKSILDAYYNATAGVYSPDFPDKPPTFFNFVGNDLPDAFTTKSTKVTVLEYNTTVEIVFQGTNMLGGENHPMHLHGHSFYVVGTGFGNFNNSTDPPRYNLKDPPYQNTIGVPKNGWAAIRFRAANPGVWFMHCHYDRHTLWGMDTVFITKNGNGTDARMLPPPSDKPPC